MFIRGQIRFLLKDSKSKHRVVAIINNLGQAHDKLERLSQERPLPQKAEHTLIHFGGREYNFC